jgi:hypothetical protein
LKSETRGRKKKEYNEVDIRKIISLFRKEKNDYGRLKYLEIYNFKIKLYQDGRIENKYSENFWRKSGGLGKELIDESNEIIMETVETIAEKEIQLPRIADVIEKHYNDKKQLHLYLNTYETEMKKLIVQLKKSDEKTKKLEEKNFLFEEENKNLKVQAKFYEQKINEVFRTSHKNPDTENLINTGKSRTKTVQKILENTFSDTNNVREDKENNKVVTMKKRTLLDDFNSLVKK